ncbi:MAG TPA: hypothetical protein VKA04_06040 [Pseudodesulfovibrio sp.]|nr:hypothetical protein [Pseudodesulfovibrio sp.]
MEYEQAQDRYSRARSNLDNAKVDKLALQCGKTSDQIRAMRDSGMGWGRITKECGEHGMGKGNGKGKNKAMMDQSMDEEMTQDMGTMSKGNSKSKKPKKK